MILYNHHHHSYCINVETINVYGIKEERTHEQFCVQLKVGETCQLLVSDGAVNFWGENCTLYREIENLP